MEERNRPDEIRDLQARFFNGAVDLFDTEHSERIKASLGEIVSMSGLREGELVLDAGAGVGVLVPYLAGCRPSKIIACDISGMMLERLRQKYPFVETLHCPLKDVTLEDQSVDLVFMNAMFSNVVDKPATLATVERVLKPGGRLVISHPEGKAFVETLRGRVPFPLDPLPDFCSLQEMLKGTSLRLDRYVAKKRFYFARAVKQPQRRKP